MGPRLRLQSRTFTVVSLFIDTSVWSLVFRRDIPSNTPHASRLGDALRSRESIQTTGLVLQELLQGFQGPRARDAIVDRFTAIPMIAPDRDDHIEAADLRNTCRRRGVQVGTVDALIIRLCLRYDLTLLTTDLDFTHAANHVPLSVWQP